MAAIREPAAKVETTHKSLFLHGERPWDNGIPGFRFIAIDDTVVGTGIPGKGLGCRNLNFFNVLIREFAATLFNYYGLRYRHG